MLRIMLVAVIAFAALILVAGASAAGSSFNGGDGGLYWEAHHGECQWYNAGQVLRRYPDGIVVCSSADFRVKWVVGGNIYDVGS